MTSDPGWDLYRSFLAVMQEGSLSGAARRLGLTQPTVSRHIDALEAAIGADLFLRSQRGLAPNEMALDLEPYARTLDLTAAAARRAASARVGEIRGRVRVSASEVVGVEHLPPILARLRRRYPDLVVELVLSNALDDLLRREADIALRMVAPTQDALVTRRLPSVAVGLHARRDYLERRGAPGSVADLAQHDIIGFDKENPATRAVAAAYPALDRGAFALCADSDLAQLAAIRAGFGIGMCQVSVARRDPELVRVLAEEVTFEFGLWLAMHEDLRTSARCRAVFDALAEGLAASVAGSSISV